MVNVIIFSYWTAKFFFENCMRLDYVPVDSLKCSYKKQLLQGNFLV